MTNMHQRTAKEYFDEYGFSDKNTVACILATCKPDVRDVTLENYANVLNRISPDLVRKPDEMEDVLRRNKKQPGAQDLADRTYNAYYVAILAYLSSIGEADTDLYNEYKKRLLNRTQRINADESLQRRSAKEEIAWASPIALRKNQLLLRKREELFPEDITTHLRALLYDFVCECGPEVAAFRLQAITTTKLLTPETMILEDDDLNYFLIHESGIHEGSVLILNKTKVSQSRRTPPLQMPRSFHERLLASMKKFPREYFMCSTNNPARAPMSTSNASTFVKQSWILDDREQGPSENMIRSAFFTAYFLNHDNISERMKYAERSGTSLTRMEINYNKVDTDTKLIFNREDAKAVANHYKGVTLSSEEEQRAMSLRRPRGSGIKSIRKRKHASMLEMSSSGDL